MFTIKKQIDPLLIYEQLKQENSILLETLPKGKSYIALNPDIIFKSKGNNITIEKHIKNKKTQNINKEINKNTNKDITEIKDIIGNPFKELKRLTKNRKCFGYLGYDLVHFIEKLPRKAKDDLQLPDSYLIFPKTIIEFDEDMINIEGEDTDNILKIIKKIKNKKQIIVKPRKVDYNIIKRDNIKSSFTYKEYENAVKKAKEHVLRGDSFQVKLSQRLEFNIKDPFAIYKKLRVINPSPYSAFLNLKDLKLVSCSPELLLKIKDKEATTKPIGGTYPRGKDQEDDENLKKRFMKDEKELAEHTMLIDLERNDLGKVCNYGSVKVDELMKVESYSHLMHIVTTIRGKLHKSKDIIDTIKAMFPGGTITGCPKVRTMEIIDDLEPVTRGPYTGCIGMIGKDNCTLSIIIRTLICKENKGYLHVGGGIVADSNAKREYEETLEKGMALIEAIK